MSIPAKVSGYLTKAKQTFAAVTHRTVFTAYDLAATLREELASIGKTLLVKTEAGFHLIVLPANRRLNLSALKKHLGVKKITIATEKDMVRELKVKPGAITPFGTLHKIPVVVDRALLKAKTVVLGTGSFTDSVKMKVADFVKLEQAVVGAFSEAAGLKLPKAPKPKKALKRPTRRAPKARRSVRKRR